MRAFPTGCREILEFRGKNEKKYKGRVPKNKMEIFNEGGGVSRSINFFSFFFKTIENHSLTVKTCFANSLGFILYTYSN